jgi:uncharacterized protein YukE
MATITRAELDHILSFATQTDDRANEIDGQFRAWHANAMASAAKWTGQGGGTNIQVVSALEGAVGQVTAKLRDCAERARTAHRHYVAGDTQQADAMHKAAQHVAAQGGPITDKLT